MVRHRYDVSRWREAREDIQVTNPIIRVICYDWYVGGFLLVSDLKVIRDGAGKKMLLVAAESSFRSAFIGAQTKRCTNEIVNLDC